VTREREDGKWGVMIKEQSSKSGIKSSDLIFIVRTIGNKITSYMGFLFNE
jgi:hypothetical protein